jgi:hypothetical protein
VARIRREYGRLGAGEAAVTVAADFMTGGAPSYARAFDRRGQEIEPPLERWQGETIDNFSSRALLEAAGASRVVLGGLSPVGAETAATVSVAAESLPRGLVSLPDVPLHPSQREAVALIEANRRVCLVAGRRWGKSTTLIALAVGYAMQGRRVGLFAPTFRLLKDPLMDGCISALGGLPAVAINRTLNEIALMGGGSIKGWSLDFTGRAARGQGLHIALVDEAAHDEGYLADTLGQAIMPALLDYDGRLVLASTPAGLEGAFWEAANDATKGYVVHHAPTSANPRWSAESIAYLRSTMRAEEASQEIDALFLDTGGASIFPLHLFLEDGEPVPDDDVWCDFVGLAIDSNSGAGGPDRDGCAAVVFAGTPGVNVTIVDWDIVSLAQGHVGDWVQHVRGMAMKWWRRLNPMQGAPKAWVEPAGNGFSIIETLRAQGLNPNAISANFVALGKDNRALAAEPHVTGGLVKITKSALDKRTNYRGVTANHLVRQVTGFKTFDKDSYKREDDLLDAAVYSILLSLGDGVKNRWASFGRVA